MVKKSIPLLACKQNSSSNSHHAHHLPNQAQQIVRWPDFFSNIICKVSLESVHYNDSIENLQWQVMKSIYNDGEDEYNSRELVYILFDSDLVIREIRFLDLHTKKPYKQKLIKAIKCTENNWHADSKSDWYLYRYVQRIIWCRLKCQNKMQRYNTKVLYLVTSSKKCTICEIFWLAGI